MIKSKYCRPAGQGKLRTHPEFPKRRHKWARLPDPWSLAYSSMLCGQLPYLLKVSLALKPHCTGNSSDYSYILDIISHSLDVCVVQEADWLCLLRCKLQQMVKWLLFPIYIDGAMGQWSVTVARIQAFSFTTLRKLRAFRGDGMRKPGIHMNLA